MTDFQAIALAGESIVRYLRSAFVAVPPLLDPAENPNDPHVPRTIVVELADAASLKSITKSTEHGTIVTLLLYRVDVNRALRSTMGMVPDRSGATSLPLDLFYLLTAWAPNATEEHLIIGRAMQALEQGTPLSGPATLTRIGGMTTDETLDKLSIVIDELSNEAMMRIFESLRVEYRLSIPYIARVTTISTRDGRSVPPVLDERIRLMVPS